jgi:hypothetical protein
MVCWSSLFVRWRCWHMVIGWGWSCGSVFSAYPLTLPRSICELFCGFFWFCTLKCSVGGSVANLIILFCHLWVTVHCKNLYVWFPCTSLFSCICSSRKSRAKITLSFKWQLQALVLVFVLGPIKSSLTFESIFNVKHKLVAKNLWNASNKYVN